MAAVQGGVKFQDQTGAIIKQRFIGFLLQFSEDSQRDEAAGAASQTSEGASFSQSQPPHHVRYAPQRRGRRPGDGVPGPASFPRARPRLPNLPLSHPHS